VNIIQTTGMNENPRQ